MYLQREPVQLGSIELAITKTRPRGTPVPAPYQSLGGNGGERPLWLSGDALECCIEGGVPLVYENEIMGASGVSGSSPRKTPLVQLRRAEFPPPSRLALRVQDDNHIAGWQARRFQ
jgi:hypothetical protein